MSKNCGRCGERKELSCFHKDRLRADGLANSCKPCCSAACAEYRARQKKAPSRKYDRKDHDKLKNIDYTVVYEGGRRYLTTGGQTYTLPDYVRVKAFIFENVMKATPLPHPRPRPTLPKSPSPA